MLSFDDVYTQIEKLTEFDDDGKKKIESFCKSAVATVNSLLKPDADASDIRLIMAAASLAYYRYIQFSFDEDAEMTSLKVGDVTVKRDSSLLLKKARTLYEDAFADARSMLTDTAFVFSAV